MGERAAGSGDVGSSGEPVQVDGEVAHSGYDGKTHPGADLGLVFGEDAHSVIAVNVRAPGQHGADTDRRDRNETVPPSLPGSCETA